MPDTPRTTTDSDLILTLRSPHYDSAVCRLAAQRIEELTIERNAALGELNLQNALVHQLGMGANDV